MSIQRRVENLEKAANITDSGECSCRAVRGVSGQRLTWRYERPEEQRPEDVARLRDDSDTVERCQRCGRVRPHVEIVYVYGWRQDGPAEQAETG